ncbi:hypothetical protein LCGC14_1303090 [marine sediment metagenome]|uniref:Uncharacterized protein n=1 Tax=marine sediment metagenome TaxID=412755 RepID=A0A0F9KC07_9ZZZZ
MGWLCQGRPLTGPHWVEDTTGICPEHGSNCWAWDYASQKHIKVPGFNTRPRSRG